MHGIPAFSNTGLSYHDSGLIVKFLGKNESLKKSRRVYYGRFIQENPKILAK
jgi:hypothetical protein